MSKATHYAAQLERLTDDLIFKSLVFTDGLTVSLTFVFLPAEVFDCFVVEETISVDSSGDL